MIVSKPTHLVTQFYLLKHVRVARGRCECLFVHITCLRFHSGVGFIPITSFRAQPGVWFVTITSLCVHSGVGFVTISSVRVHTGDWFVPVTYLRVHTGQGLVFITILTCSHRHWATPGRLLGCHLKEPCPPGSSSVSTSTTHGHWWRWVLQTHASSHLRSSANLS